MLVDRCLEIVAWRLVLACRSMLAGDLIGYRDGSCLEIGSCLRSEAIYGDLTSTEMEIEREQQIRKMGRARERARVCKEVVERNNKKKLRRMNILLKYLLE